MSLTARLKDTVVIQRRTLGAQNDYGVKAQTWATHATVKGWLQESARTEQAEQTSGGAQRIDAVVFMLVTDVTEADRLVVGGYTWNISRVHNPASKNHHLEIDVDRERVN